MGVAAPGTFTARPPTGFTLCEQLCRHWAARSTYQPEGQALTFCEPNVSTPANLYAADLPVKSKRREVAASVTVEGHAQSIGDPTSQFTVVVECHAEDPRQAVTLAEDLVRCLLDRAGTGRWWFDEPAVRDATDIRGAIGLPAMTTNAHVGFWRVLSVERAGGPLVVRPTPNTASPGRSPSGQSLAVLTLVITAVPVEWIEGVTPGD